MGSANPSLPGPGDSEMLTRQERWDAGASTAAAETHRERKKPKTTGPSGCLQGGGTGPGLAVFTGKAGTAALQASLPRDGEGTPH